MPNLFEQARQIYPRLPGDVAYRERFGQGSPMLEFYPKGESDSFDPSRPAVEVYDQRTRPEDVAGDIVSHEMVNSDPSIAGMYNKFLMSMPPFQQRHLQQQYDYAVKNEGETRPFSQWSLVSGEPAYLRGGAFGQWPDAEKMYTPEQFQIFDAMKSYLRGRPEAPISDRVNSQRINGAANVMPRAAPPSGGVRG